MEILFQEIRKFYQLLANREVRVEVIAVKTSCLLRCDNRM